MPSNSANSSFGILPRVFTSTFRRPRWAMPMTISCTPLAPRALDQLVHRRDEALAAFEREALLADVLGVQVALESFGRRQALEDVALLLGGERGRRTDRFEALLDPALLRGIGDVHELDAEVAAVGVAQRLDQVAQRHVLLPEVRVRGREHRVHVGFGQVVERGLQFGNDRAFLSLQRIQIRPAVAEEPVGRDDRLDVDLLARDRQVGRRHFRDEGVGLGALREGLDDRSVGDVARVRRAIGPRNQLHLVEVGAPLLGHGARIVEVTLIELLDVRRIAAKQVRIDLELSHHRLHLKKRVSRSRCPPSPYSRRGLVGDSGSGFRSRCRVIPPAATSSPRGETRMLPPGSRPPSACRIDAANRPRVVLPGVPGHTLTSLEEKPRPP